MIIYIDNNCKCHVSNPDGIYTEIEAPEMFEGKCSTFIEGYIHIPYGDSVINEDGIVLRGELTTPWRDLSLLNEFQRQYEEQQLAINEYEVALTEIETALGV